MIGAILGDMIGAPYEFDRGDKRSGDIGKGQNGCGNRGRDCRKARKTL